MSYWDFCLCCHFDTHLWLGLTGFPNHRISLSLDLVQLSLNLTILDLHRLKWIDLQSKSFRNLGIKFFQLMPPVCILDLQIFDFLRCWLLIREGWAPKILNEHLTHFYGFVVKSEHHISFPKFINSQIMCLLKCSKLSLECKILSIVHISQFLDLSQSHKTSLAVNLVNFSLVPHFHFDLLYLCLTLWIDSGYSLL